MPDAPNPLLLPVARLSGVGRRAEGLERLEIKTAGDLLLHRPRRYEDRRNFLEIAKLQLNEPALTRGKIIAAGVNYWKKRAGSVFEFIMEDATGRLHCRWWNLPYMEKKFKVGDEVMVFGKPNSLRPRTIDHPETELVEELEEAIHLNRIVPIYPLTEGVSQRWLRALVWRTLEGMESHIAEPHPEFPLPDLPTRANAVYLMHRPEEMADLEIARKRLALDEFVELQLSMRRRRLNLEKNAMAQPCSGDNHLIKPFLGKIGFTLTAAQTKVLKEIRQDMGGKHPMRRLLQGDVGSGKTVVAACTALMALESDRNVALMAPTEILAEQHAQNFRRWFEPLGISVEMLTGSVKGVAKNQPGLSLGSSSSRKLYVGTHALLEDSFAPEKLGLVIIDEQHKFGVSQRETLLRKGAYPHLLVMTATPIPRTLGLTIYGDLDISVINESPVGRGQIKTYLRTQESLPKVWSFMKENLAKGRQGYIVYSRLEEGDSAIGLKAVTKEFEELRKVFAPYKVALLHGKLKGAEKDAVMTEFRENRVQLLLATSVVEVGLDVPNATMMLIENAEQFGLAQLHQLRGRIGRGAEESHCILIAKAKTEEAKDRLQIMTETTDGFRIAEEDLKLRGPGQLLGQEQSGAAALKFGDLAQDLGLVERARELVKNNIQNPSAKLQ